MGVLASAVTAMLSVDPITASLFTALALGSALCFLLLSHGRRGSAADGGDASSSNVPFLWKEITPVSDTGAPPAPGAHAGLSSTRLSVHEELNRSKAFLALMSSRRSLRFFSPDPINSEVLENVVATAGTAPSGAHKQPWVFCVVRDPKTRMEIRKLVEAEEVINYERRMKKSWVHDVDHLVNELHDDGAPIKPYLSEAPALIVVFKEVHGVDEFGEHVEHYYVQESVGIAVGILLAALHNVGLATLTSTPMGAESKIRDLCDRGKNEKVFLLLPVGYPAKNATVPFRGPTQHRKLVDKLMPQV